VKVIEAKFCVSW